VIKPSSQQNARYRVSRRHFLGGMAGTLALGGMTRLVRALPDPIYPFEEIPPAMSGITWVHSAGKSAARYLPETTGPGSAFLDYDNDGWMDIYFVNSAPGWSSSAVWFDYDNDGRLDLFVCQFVEFSKSLNKSCGPGEEGKHGYCIPRLYKPMPSWLFHNNGDGTFTDVSKTSGIANYLGKAWGVVATDVNNDGRLDLFVGNDTVPNFLFMNRGNGKFEETATYAGVAYSSDGRARSGMGVDSADFNEDGWMDLFVANIDGEMFAIYQNNHDETFDDQAGPTGIGAATRLMSGWGLKFFDYDNDGNLDLFLANGNPDDLIEILHSQVKYQEPLMLFHNTGKTGMSVRKVVLYSRSLCQRVAWRLETSTMTGRLMFWSPLTTLRPFFFATTLEVKTIGWE
jgi:hypothetical protein